MDNPGPEVLLTSEVFTMIGRSFGKQSVKSNQIFIQEVVTSPSKPEQQPPPNWSVFNEPDFRGRRRR